MFSVYLFVIHFTYKRKERNMYFDCENDKEIKKNDGGILCSRRVRLNNAQRYKGQPVKQIN